MSLSAGDWSRIKRLQKATSYASALETDVDIINQVSPPSCPVGSSSWPHRRTDRDRIAGSSKTRRETSKWIDFVASQRQDYVLRSEGSTCETTGGGIKRTLTTLCPSGGPCQTVLNTKTGLCGCKAGRVGQNLRIL